MSWPTCPRAPRGLIAAFAQTIFLQPDGPSAERQLGDVAEHLAERFPKAAETLLAGAADVLAFTAFPVSHWRKIWSTNPLERVNKEIKRRTDVVGIFLHVLLDAGTDRFSGRCCIVAEGRG